jgi:nucleoside-diphosphate-sugar epimerase
MRVLVTGHHGYIGSVLAPILREAGHVVVGLDTFLYQGCDFGDAPEWEPALRIDVRDVQPEELAEFDAVVHLAALSNDPLGDLDPGWTYGINLEGTVSLARAAKEAGVRRFVFASSCSIYGASGSDDLLDEEAPLRPLTPYAETKVRAEEQLAGLADAGFSPIFMRNATAYGVSPRLRLDVVLNNLAAYAHTTGRITLLSDGSSWRPLVHVQDIARATLALIDAPSEKVHGEAFNIGSSDQNVRIRELAEMLSAHSSCDVEMSDEAAPDPRSYCVDFGKLARALPGFSCSWTPTRGAEELLSAYRDVGLSTDDFAGSRYVRVRRLKELLDESSLDGDLRVRPTAREFREETER